MIKTLRQLATAAVNHIPATLFEGAPHWPLRECADGTFVENAAQPPRQRTEAERPIDSSVNEPAPRPCR